MRLAITTESVMTRYAVKDGQIYYVKLSKPHVISDLDDYFAKPDITPYMGSRTIYYGVFVDDQNVYSARSKNIRTFSKVPANSAQRMFERYCALYGCNLSWEEAKKLAGWE